MGAGIKNITWYVLTVTSKDRCRSTSLLPLDGQPSRSSLCSNLLDFGETLDGPKVSLTGQGKGRPSTKTFVHVTLVKYGPLD